MTTAPAIKIIDESRAGAPQADVFDGIETEPLRRLTASLGLTEWVDFRGYLPESAPSYAEMRVADYLAFIGRRKGITVCLGLGVQRN